MFCFTIYNHGNVLNLMISRIFSAKSRLAPLKYFPNSFGQYLFIFCHYYENILEAFASKVLPLVITLSKSISIGIVLMITYGI